MPATSLTRTAEVLCLHYVAPGVPTRRNTVSVEELVRLVRARQERGMRCVALSAFLEDESLPGERDLAISFDDAHASVLRYARPALEALGVTATLFVPTAWVGTSDELLDWDELRRLRDAGWELGSHSDTHPRMGWRLYDEDEAAHRARLIEDLGRSREAMERMLGVAPRLFAYPYGEAPAIAREAARAAGFEAAFTVAGDREWHGDRFAIPRIDPLVATVTSEAPTDFAVIVPACDRPHIVSDVARRLASQSYPKERYEVVIVDDGSREELGRLFPEAPPNLRVVRQGDATFRAGQARQRGVDETRASHLVFLDADVAVEPDFLWHLDWVHRRARDTVLLGYLSGYNLHDLGHLHTPRDVIGHALERLPILPDRSREPTLRRCLDNLDWLATPWPLTYTGNLSLPRGLLARAGGFADEFVGWGLEDVDLGVRLFRAGGRFAFSRFAVGYHVVDPDEPASRNPFRAPRPTRADFAGYLANLERLAARHAGDPAVEAYVARSRADIDETCGRPRTVGIELGGAATVRSIHHRRLHVVQPGGVPKHELLDRLAYAHKVGARTLYLLGGAPAEHGAFLELLRAAKLEWIAMRSVVYPFARGALAKEAADAGLCGVTCLVHSMQREPYERAHGPGTFDAFEEGLARLAAERLELSAELVVDADTCLDAELAALRAAALRLEEVTLLDPTRLDEVRAATGLAPRLA